MLKARVHEECQICAFSQGAADGIRDSQQASFAPNFKETHSLRTRSRLRDGDDERVRIEHAGSVVHELRGLQQDRGEAQVDEAQV